MWELPHTTLCLNTICLNLCALVLILINVECPYEGQIREECAPHPSCSSTCDILNGVAAAHPCIETCVVNGCVCPNGTISNEASKKCVTPSECDGM